MPHDGQRTGAETTSGESRGVDRRQFLAAAGAGGTAALAGCGILGGGGGGDPIRIGAIYLLSGVAEQLGAGSEAAAEVAVDVINEEGGINGREVEIEVRDHGDDPQAQIRSLVQEFGADVMLGLTSSGVTLNSGPTIESLGVPFTLTDIGTPFITEPDTETFGDYYETDDGRAAGLPNLFRTNSMTAHMTYAIAQYTADNFSGGLRVANAGPDYAYGQQCWSYYQAYLDGLGFDYEVVQVEFPQLAASDMTPNISNIVDADPDVVFTSFWANDTVTFTSQAAEQGLFEQVDDVFDTIGADPVNFQALGDTMPEGVHYSGWYWPGAYGTDADEEFLSAYEDAYADDDNILAYPTFTGGSTWAAVNIYKQAIEAAGSTDPGEVISEMEGLTYEEDPRGAITLDENSHQANASCIIGESSFDADVPYDGAGQVNTQEYTIERSEALDLLSGSGLPPGM